MWLAHVGVCNGGDGVKAPTESEALKLAHHRVRLAMPLGWPHVRRLLQTIAELRARVDVAEAETEAVRSALVERKQRGTAGEPRL